MTDKAYQTKVWLDDLENYDHDIKKALDRYNQFSIGCKVSNYEIVCHSSDINPLENKLYKRQILYNRLENTKEIFARELIKRFRAICLLDESIEKIILLKRYLLFYPVSEIQKELDISKQCYYDHHKKALENLAVVPGIER